MARMTIVDPNEPQVEQQFNPVDDQQNDIIQETHSDQQEPAVPEESYDEVPQQVDTAVEDKKEEERYQQKNFARLREEKDRYQREVEQKDQMIRQYEDYINRMPQPEQQAQAPQHKDDDLPEWGAVKNYSDNKYNQLKKDQDELRQIIHNQSMEQKVRNAHPDYFDVVTMENTAKLRQAYPELAQALYTSTDEYVRAVSTYKMLKQLGIVTTKDPNAAQFEANKSRPRSASSVSPRTNNSPLSQANEFSGDLSQARMDELYRETLAAARNI